MAMLSTVLIALATIVFVFVAKHVYSGYLRPSWFLRDIPGPPSDSILMGNMSWLSKKGAVIYEEWQETYGPVYQSSGLLMRPRVFITDERALRHILISKTSDFPKPQLLKRIFGDLLGNGILFAEGAEHVQQRKILNPAFGPIQIKGMYSLMVDKVLTLQRKMLSITETTLDGGAKTHIDVYDYATRAVSDIIGSAGFGCDLGSIDQGTGNALGKSFNTVFTSLGNLGAWQIIKIFAPLGGRLPDFSGQAAAQSHAVLMMKQAGREMVKEKKAAVLQEMSSSETDGLRAANFAGRDLLSLLIKANMAQDIKPSQRLSDETVEAQISTFMLAGNDSTAATVTWALFAMCQRPEVQDRLRSEIISLCAATDSDTREPDWMPSYDELNSLRFLDGVVRETLRVHAPMVGISRMVANDCVIPLGKPLVAKDGTQRTEIRVAKGTFVVIPIIAMNKDPQVWGADAKEFRPERWVSSGSAVTTESPLPEGVMEIPSVHFPTFLAGPRGCIGFRFSIVETKALLFSMVRSFKFELAVPIEEIEAKVTAVVRPKVRSVAGYQLPMLIERG